MDDGTNLRLIARRGDPAPGFGIDKWLGINEQEPTINGNGEVAFTTFVHPPIGAEISATYVESDGTLRLVAATGDQLPGLSPTENIVRTGVPAINDRGEVAFGATVEGSNVNSKK